MHKSLLALDYTERYTYNEKFYIVACTRVQGGFAIYRRIFE
jgi:hypothetical protein